MGCSAAGLIHQITTPGSADFISIAVEINKVWKITNGFMKLIKKMKVIKGGRKKERTEKKEGWKDERRKDGQKTEGKSGLWETWRTNRDYSIQNTHILEPNPYPTSKATGTFVKKDSFCNLEEGSLNYCLWAKSIPMPGFESRVLLELSHIHPFTYCL